jgi:hypothetical protein
MDKSPIDTFFLFDSFFIKKNKDIFLERLDKLIRINNQLLYMCYVCLLKHDCIQVLLQQMYF